MSPEDMTTMGLSAVAILEAMDASDSVAFDALLKEKDLARGAVGLAYCLLGWRGQVLPDDVLSILRERMVEQL